MLGQLTGSILIGRTETNRDAQCAMLWHSSCDCRQASNIVLNADPTGALKCNNQWEQYEMATNNRGRGGRNHNPAGRNQYSGVMGTARANPLSTAAAVGGAVAAGVLLWARRNQISDQIGNLSDQVSGWSEGLQSGDEPSESAAGGNSSSPHEGRTQAEIAQEALTLKELNQGA